MIYFNAVDCGVESLGAEVFDGSVDFLYTTLHSTATYTCADGCQFTRMCQEDGLWQGNVPLCQQGPVKNIPCTKYIETLPEIASIQA